MIPIEAPGFNAKPGISSTAILPLPGNGYSSIKSEI
jgi:hypothetical protein